MQGTYDSKTGLYYFPTFTEKALKPIFFANPYAMSADKVDLACQLGYDSWAQKRPRTIVPFAKAKWEQYKAEGYDFLLGKALLHCFEADNEPEVIPSWASDWDSYNNLPIKEYEAGKVLWLWENEQVYSYFDLITPPASEPTPEQPDDIPVGVPTRWRVRGKVWFMNVDLVIEAEE